MKVKKEYLVLIAAIAILVLYLVLRPTADNMDSLPQPAKVDSNAIDRLIITDKQNTPLDLVKKDERWFISPHGYQSDTAKVKNMIKAIADLTLTALISESGNYERYGLAADEKTTVQAFGADAELRAFDIGRTAPTQQHTFVLVNGDSKVYHARGQIGRTFEHTIASLRDKTVFDFDRTEITAITLQKGENTLLLTQRPIIENGEKPEAMNPDRHTLKEWQDPLGQTANQEAVTTLLDGMARMDCDGYLDDQASERLTDMRWSVLFESEQEAFTLMIYDTIPDDDSKVAAIASTNPYAFVLNQERVQRYETALGALLGKESVE